MCACSLHPVHYLLDYKDFWEKSTNFTLSRTVTLNLPALQWNSLWFFVTWNTFLDTGSPWWRDEVKKYRPLQLHIVVSPCGTKGYPTPQAYISFLRGNAHSLCHHFASGSRFPFSTEPTTHLISDLLSPIFSHLVYKSCSINYY